MKESKKKIIIDIINKRKIEILKDIIQSKKKINAKKIPYGGHWVFFNENTSLKETGKDGHIKRGIFFPKLLGYKRMFAGSSLEFKKDINLDISMKKISYIKEVVRKKYNGNNLYFFKLYNSYERQNIKFLKEIQTIVFIKNKYKKKKRKSNQDSNNNLELLLSKNFKYNNIDLFKYSSLTNNSHRIHYDLKYTKEVEGHKDLLVHGPLIATTVLNEVDNLIKKKIINFNFSIQNPILVNEIFTLKIYHQKKINKKLYIKVFNRKKEISLMAETISG